MVVRQWEFTLFDGPDTPTTSTTGTRKSALRRIGPAVLLACGLIPLASITSKTQGQQAPTSDRSLPHHGGTSNSPSTPVASPKDLNLLWEGLIEAPVYPWQPRLVCTPASSGTVVISGGRCGLRPGPLNSNPCPAELSATAPASLTALQCVRSASERTRPVCPQIPCRVVSTVYRNITSGSS